MKPRIALDDNRVRRLPGRYYSVLWIIFAAVGVLLARLWYLQIAQGEELAGRAETVRTRLIREAPPRGIIEDRNGTLLATNQSQFVVSVLPDALRKKPERIRLVADLLEMPESELRAAIEHSQAGPYPLVIARLKTGESLRLIARLKEREYSLPEVKIEARSLRNYPQGKAFTHLIGYVGQVSEHELPPLRAFTEWQASAESENRSKLPSDLKIPPDGYYEQIETPTSIYDGGDFVGKTGLERAYELYLHGLPGGDRVEVTPIGRQVRLLEKVRPQTGASLILALDARLQRHAHELLQGRKGAVVAIDPRSGEVLTLASQPSFDPNLFVGRIPASLWQSLSNNPASPMQNRALQSAYAPGSTFKPVNAVQALRSGTITTRSGVRCPGGMQMGGRFFRCWQRHGYVDFYHSLSLSCDTFYYSTARQMGPDALAGIAREFGMGARTGIDLPNEGSGLVPDPKWKEKQFEEPWYGGETLNYGIGQGALTATPLQMAVVTAAIANRGTVYRPHVVKRVLNSTNGKALYEAKPEVSHRIEAAPEHWAAVIEGLRRAVSEGTARGCRLPGIEIAGKTGSAEFRKGGRTHSWFIAFAPVENPRVAICVMAEEAGHGGDVAVPIARAWLELFFKLGY